MVVRYNLICEGKMGHLEFVDQRVRVICVLKELFYNEVMSYWHYPKDIQVLIEELSTRNFVNFQITLFSRNEQDYLDYNLNK